MFIPKFPYTLYHLSTGFVKKVVYILWITYTRPLIIHRFCGILLIGEYLADSS